MPTYVNVPASPSPPRQLHYLGLQLQEGGAGIRGGSAGALSPGRIGPGPGARGHPLTAPKPALRPWPERGVGAPPPAHLGLLAGAGASRYAQIDILATEAAHRAGARHAQAREERLPALEQRRKGTPR